MGAIDPWLPNIAVGLIAFTRCAQRSLTERRPIWRRRRSSRPAANRGHPLSSGSPARAGFPFLNPEAEFGSTLIAKAQKHARGIVVALGAREAHAFAIGLLDLSEFHRQ